MGNWFQMLLQTRCNSLETTLQFRVNLFWWVHCFLALHFKFFQCCCIGILKQTEPTVFTLWRGYQPTQGFTCSCLCILNWNMNWKYFTHLTSRNRHHMLGHVSWDLTLFCAGNLNERSEQHGFFYKLPF